MQESVMLTREYEKFGTLLARLSAKPNQLRTTQRPSLRPRPS